MRRANSVEKRIKKIANPKRAGFPARMGSGTDYANIETGTPNLIWVTYEGSGIVAKVWNLHLPAKPGLRVIVGMDEIENPGLLQVLRERLQPGMTPTLPLPAHHTTHELYGDDQVRVFGGAIMPLNAEPIPNTFKVLIYDAIVLTGAVWTNCPKQNVNLTSNIPATGAIWALLQVESSGVVTIKESSVVTSKNLLTIPNIPLPDANCYPAWAVQLYAGQEKLRKDDVINDFKDLRWANGYLGGGVVLGTFTPDRVAITDATGVLTTDADLKYNAANNALTLGSPSLPVTVSNVLNIIAESGSLARYGFVYDDNLTASDYDATVRAGGTHTDPTKVLTDMVIKRWRGRGYYDALGGISDTKVEIRAVADGDWSPTSNPTRIEIWTTPVDSTTLTLAMTVGSDQIVYDKDGLPVITAETDPVFLASEAAGFVAGDKAKLDGIEAGAQVNDPETDPVHAAWLAATRVANTFPAGPATGADAALTWRALVAADMAALLAAANIWTADQRGKAFISTKSITAVNYDGNGRVTSIVFADGRTVTATWAGDYVASISDGINTWTPTYNGSHQITAIIVT